MAENLVQRLETARRPFRELAGRLAEAGQLDRPTASGWTAKEMLAHVAFWQECCEPVVRGMYRKEIPIDQWRFGSGYTPEEEWPADTVHNAREAAWGRAQPAEAVMARWDAAHESAKAVLATVTDAEAAQWAQYFDDAIGHLEEHHAELEAAV
jgi:hypothetical protein